MNGLEIKEKIIWGIYRPSCQEMQEMSCFPLHGCGGSLNSWHFLAKCLTDMSPRSFKMQKILGLSKKEHKHWVAFIFGSCIFYLT